MSTFMRRALVTVIAAPFLASAAMVSQAAAAPPAPKAVTTATAHPDVPAYSCATLKNWLDNHKANTPEWHKVSLMWSEQC
ncbi:hypothetical protein ACH4E7_41865 [Kitasatospora sp. NPDC018058]|uniref:hypothetical protein n=1 Tax=Kitasatospora sp. NPDC018058 TaxID=3364025 RepID=UPI0037C11F9B